MEEENNQVENENNQVEKVENENNPVESNANNQMETENSENEMQNINEANTVNDIAESSSSSDDECLADIKRKLILNDIKVRQEIDRSSQYKDISSTDNDDDRDPDFIIRKEDL